MVFDALTDYSIASGRKTIHGIVFQSDYKDGKYYTTAYKYLDRFRSTREQISCKQAWELIEQHRFKKVCDMTWA